MDVHLKNLFSRFQEQFGSGPGLGPGSGACLMKVDGIAPPFIKSLYKAAAALYRTDPWRRLRPGHLFGVKAGKDSDWYGRKQPFPCIQFIGGDGGDLGFHMFKSEIDAKKMTGSRETIRVPNVELLRVTFEAESVMFPSNKRMIKSLSLEVSGENRFPVIDVARCTESGEIQFRNPTLEELRFVYAFMKAILLLHPLLRQDFETGPKWSRLISFQPFIETVDVQWPAEMARGNDLVAVTISHPPGHGYEEKNSSRGFEDKYSSRSSTPTKYSESPREETFYEVEVNSMISLRQCSMCEKEIEEEQSLCCGRCRAVIYCTSLCQQQHWIVAHEDTCGLYKAMMEREEELAMKIFTFDCSVEQPCKWLESLGIHRKGMWRRKCHCYSHCPFGLLPVKDGLWDSWGSLDDGEYPHDSPFDNNLRDGLLSPIILSGWFEYYSLRSLPLSSPVADILSHPLTLYHILTALNISSKNLLLKGKEVILHYLGPEGELDWIPAFAEIGHLLNGVGNIQIAMVGPGVPTNLSGTTSGISSRVRVNLIQGVYQEVATYLPTPHLIVALNSGLETYSSWGGALDLIKSMNTPAFFTEESELSCSNAKQGLFAAGLYISYPVTPNPFRSPVRNYGPFNNLPSYSNGFVFGVNT
ncbi:zinc finger MYND domain-containing protein 15 [Olea europaea var. sylvestris]|uniref:zinc finger MYND domain-containing protein 15 n=1 Tax=Olea europaea var. sylvestris TaxID=158386 RepID=UPI000C1D7A09|nr:zinc finger MYND domain-containing protein 15 [Olea europaea var. sylvestris]